ncbi:MAG: fibronectin type III domain-containing protein [Acidobacteria bacterium]|nr:fibronectin type III domain-containing protein [Acidobacteriota bacterium]
MSLRRGGPSRRRAALPAALAALLIAAALAPAPATATVYVLPTDEAMVTRSPVIVFGEVLAAEPAPAGGPPATDLMFQIDEVLKGFVPGSTIVVRQPGGVGPGGVAGRVIGMPVMAEGDRVLLFLDPAEGVYRTVELALGIFFEVPAGDRVLLLRDLAEQLVLPRPGGPVAGQGTASGGPRDADRFRRWIADRAAGVERAPDYVATDLPDGPAKVVSDFRLVAATGDCENPGTRLRWRTFDRGRTLGLVVHRRGQPGAPANGHPQVLAGMRVWNQDPRSRVRLVRSGLSDEEFSLSPDDVNSISFEDPLDEIPGSFVPSLGGTLAITYGYYYCGASNPPHRVPGLGRVEAYEFIEANITTQDGYQDWLAAVQDPGLAHAQIMANELGHVLGIGHGCDEAVGRPCDTELKRTALMRGRVGGRIQGAVLSADDRSELRALYPEIGPVGPIGPSAASDLTVTAISQNELELRWRDRSHDETSFDIYERMVDSDFERIATLERNSTSVVIQNIPSATYRAYQVVARNSRGISEPTPEAGATTFAEVAECVADGDTLCLNEGRFRVEARWEIDQRRDRGDAEPWTNDTGDFRFFSPDDFELVVKVLDGCALNERYWVYAAGLTDVKVVMTVIDSETGVAATYYNPPDTPFLPVQDTTSFAVCPQGGNLYGQSRYLLAPDELESLRGGADRTSRFAGRSAWSVPPGRFAPPRQQDGACETDDLTLCLEGGRFAVRARWETADSGGDARAWPFARDTGAYWFFGPNNVEMVVRVVDGCALNGHRWVFAGGLTDLAVTMTVTDTETGEVRTWENPAGTPFEPIQDVKAFSCSAPSP